MPTQVIMPQLGESVVEGTVGRWLIAEGQPVKEYEPICTVTTDKVDTEIPAPASGILLRILVGEGQTVAAGTLLAEIGETAESGDPVPGGHELGHTPAGAPMAPAASHQMAGPGRETTTETASATPVAQRMASEHGVDLAQVPGSGPGGRITREDVEAYLAATGETPDEETSAESGNRAQGFISPAVGRLAAEMGVDLSQVVGTGAGGRITKKDVLAYIATPVPRPAPEGNGAPQGQAAGEDLPPWERPGSGDLFKPTGEMGKSEVAPAPEAARPAPAQKTTPVPTPDVQDTELVPFSAIRKSIAKHMVISSQTSPHVTTVMEADLSRLVMARERIKTEFERQGTRLTFTPFFVQAIVSGLRAVPEANSSFSDEGLRVHRRIHVGMAVAVPDGLIVPVLHDADEKSLLGLARAVNDLAERARAKRLAPDEVQGGTFTLTNHGTAGSLFATPIINQPQAGILGVGAIQKRAIVLSRGHPLLPDIEDTIAIRPMAYLSFTFDHRVLDGHGADSFLAEVKRYLEGYSG